MELIVPAVGESITEVQIGKWHKAPGDRVAKDENVVEIESDKATVDIPAPADGVVGKILKQTGEMATVGEVIGYLDPAAAPAAAPSSFNPEPTATVSPAPATTVTVEKKRGQTAIGSVQAAVPDQSTHHAPIGSEPQGRRPRDEPHAEREDYNRAATRPDGGAVRVMPAAERVFSQHKLSPESVRPTGPGGRILKEDAERAAASADSKIENLKSKIPSAPPTALSESKIQNLKSQIPPAPAPFLPPALPADAPLREEEFVVMSPIRRRIAQRLVEAQQTAALLTTFNEVDMTEVMALRQKYRDTFQERYNIKLGFMSFFVKAAIDALKLVPQVNAEVREPHIVYRNYFDIGIAVGGGKGLVVPVIRNAEFLSFAEIELAISDFARRAADNKLKLDELAGGTFTISNGGIYGSLLSTPIVNPPQSGILGLHAIQDRPVARNGQVVIRPMMYLALTYDHRLVDGRDAVTFLKRIKDTIEDPTRIFLEV